MIKSSLMIKKPGKPLGFFNIECQKTETKAKKMLRGKDVGTQMPFLTKLFSSSGTDIHQFGKCMTLVLKNLF